LSDEILEFNVDINIGTSFSVIIDDDMVFLSELEITPVFDVDVLTNLEFEVEL